MSLIDEHPMLPGEDSWQWWDRLWHEGKLPDKAYGRSSVIARMRRGKRVVIPAQWRGRDVHRQTIRKRAINRLPRELTMQERRAELDMAEMI